VAFSPFPFWLLTAGVVVAGLLLGGGQSSAASGLIQLLSLVLLATTVLAIGVPPRGVLAPIGLIVAIVLVPILQLIPLPPEIWTALPGRSLAASVYSQIGVGIPWLAVSLDPNATALAALSLLPPIAVFLATLRLGFRERRALTLLFVAVGILSVLLGLAQLKGGETSSLRFYPITNTQDSVGFFANRNHYASLLCCVIPFVVAWATGLNDAGRRERVPGLIASALFYIALVVGIAMARSRAGIFLGAFATVGSFILYSFNSAAAKAAGSRGRALVGLVVLCGIIAAFQFGFNGIVDRFASDPLADLRFTIADITIRAAQTFQPYGSGLGTFVPVYQMFETPDALVISYINHAHDDWLELWLEGGWAALAIAAAFVAWFGYRVVVIWRAPLVDKPLDWALRRASTIAVLILMLHSGSDYPLRTTALMTLFAFCCALLIDPIPLPQRRTDLPLRSTWWRRTLQIFGPRKQAAWGRARFG